MKERRARGLAVIGSLLGSMLTTAAADASWPAEWRSIDGTGNNLSNPLWGSAGIPLLRDLGADYADGVSAPSGADRPGARHLSNLLCEQEGVMPNFSSATDYLWQWGQFLDHDITLVLQANPAEAFDIPVPAGDPFFDPAGTGEQVIFLDRSDHDPASGTGPDNPRQQMQSITAFIDASQVYGSDEVRAAALRTLDGTGRLRTSPGNLLPFNTDGLPNAGGPDPSLFLAGDVRANEQAALTAMHTLFVREHNRLADFFNAVQPQLDGEEVYQRARALVGAEMQVITYREFLPLLLGPDALPPYEGYRPEVNPGIANGFATAAYRVGHTMLSPVLLRLEADGQTSPWGDLPLLDAFFAPHVILDEGGIDPMLRGLAAQHAQAIDPFIVDDVRNFLFGPPGAGGFDLSALNTQRGRDHGLPGYNQARVEMGLAPVTGFSEVSSDPAVAQALADAYGDVNEVDIWIGGLSEDHVPGAMVGELFQVMLIDQFTRIRDGDRFWYQISLGPLMQMWVESVTLADVIRWNTGIGSEIQDDVFRMAVDCPGDIDGSGVVDVHDLIDLILAWGQADHPADVNGDGVVDGLDLLQVILHWGPCPA